MYLDFDHNQRSCLRNLKYPTRDLTMFRDKSGSGSVIVSITPLIQLRITCAQRQISTNHTELDLVQLKFCDQNSDAGYKIFCDRMVSLLDMFVPGRRGTQLFITAISAVMEPARNVKFGSPVDVVRSVAKGLLMLRLWKRYLLLQGLPLDAKPGAAKEPSKRGCFISAQTYSSIEIQAHATIHHQLAMFLHCNTQGIDYVSLRSLFMYPVS